MKYLVQIILSLQLIVNPTTIDDIEKNDSSKVAMINVTKSILIDNSGIRHWYIGGITRGDIHYCNVHNIYEKVDIKW